MVWSSSSSSKTNWSFFWLQVLVSVKLQNIASFRFADFVPSSSSFRQGKQGLNLILSTQLTVYLIFQPCGHISSCVSILSNEIQMYNIIWELFERNQVQLVWHVLRYMPYKLLNYICQTHVFCIVWHSIQIKTTDKK